MIIPQTEVVSSDGLIVNIKFGELTPDVGGIVQAGQYIILNYSLVRQIVFMEF